MRSSEARSWSYPDIDSRAVYLATAWAFDMRARVSEYTAAEEKGEGHYVRAGDFLFDVDPASASNTRSPARTQRPSPSSLAALYSDARALMSKAHIIARYTALLLISG
jgi:hypothetical protein